MSTRRDVRHTPDAQSLKLAASALIDAAGGSSKAAGYCRADQRRLSDYAAPNTDTFMPSDVKVALEQRTRDTAGWPQLTREEARQLGFALVPMPEAAPDCGDLLMRFAKVAKEYGDSASVIATALSDGKLDDREREDGVRELDDLIAEALAFRACLIGGAA